MRIEIKKDGPYFVFGSLPLGEEVITPVRHHYEYAAGEQVTPPDAEEYHLCRCGRSDNAPFCDGSHVASGFDGSETALNVPYLQRLTGIVEGKTMVLLDDGRCAFARFCHRDDGDVWTLTTKDEDPHLRSEAIIAASECPAGRLVAVSSDAGRQVLEAEASPAVVILQDPEKGVSAGIAVRGPVQIVSADGENYEVRNRVDLCRCGESSNKPFCHASHVPAEYVDGR